MRRQTGDMLARWQKRWENNVTRYKELSCVRLILPWSTPSMRFCTSELKTAVITSALKKRYPNHDIVNVTGVRRQESSARSKMPVSAPLAALTRRNKQGVTWNAIIEWPVEDVFSEIAEAGLALHEAYTRYGASRVIAAAGEQEESRRSECHVAKPAAVDQGKKKISKSRYRLIHSFPHTAVAPIYAADIKATPPTTPPVFEVRLTFA